jgi:uncharacterized membrane protein YeaQ/YmgE (transglycosylase-associated protein family)
MAIVSWLVLGAVVGLLASRVQPFPGGVAGGVAGGVVGAFIGGAIFTLIAGRGAATVDVLGLAVALVGAALLLVLARKAAYPHREPDR